MTQPQWLQDALEGRTVWEGREAFGTIVLNIIRQPGDPVLVTEADVRAAA